MLTKHGFRVERCEFAPGTDRYVAGEVSLPPTRLTIPGRRSQGGLAQNVPHRPVFATSLRHSFSAGLSLSPAAVSVFLPTGPARSRPCVRYAWDHSLPVVGSRWARLQRYGIFHPTPGSLGGPWPPPSGVIGALAGNRCWFRMSGRSVGSHRRSSTIAGHVCTSCLSKTRFNPPTQAGYDPLGTDQLPSTPAASSSAGCHPQGPDRRRRGRISIAGCSTAKAQRSEHVGPGPRPVTRVLESESVEERSASSVRRSLCNTRHAEAGGSPNGLSVLPAAAAPGSRPNPSDPDDRQEPRAHAHALRLKPGPGARWLHVLPDGADGQDPRPDAGRDRRAVVRGAISWGATRSATSCSWGWASRRTISTTSSGGRGSLPGDGRTCP